MSEINTSDSERAWASNFRNPRPDELKRLLACGGTDDDPHMVEMQMVWDAETPYGVCPECGHRAFLHPTTHPNLRNQGTGGDDGSA